MRCNTQPPLQNLQSAATLRTLLEAPACVVCIYLCLFGIHFAPQLRKFTQKPLPGIPLLSHGLGHRGTSQEARTSKRLGVTVASYRYGYGYGYDYGYGYGYGTGYRCSCSCYCYS